jgi:hypothetical protein
MQSVRGRLAALGFFAILPAFLGLLSSPPSNRESSILKKRVGSFRVSGLPALDALLDFGQREQIPLGVEYVSREAVEVPTTVDLHEATVTEILEAICPKNRGYRWAVEQDVVVVTHSRVPPGKQNLLNRAIPAFSVGRTPLQSANVALNMTLFPRVYPRPEPYGFVNIGEPGDPKDLVGPLNLKNPSVRRVLNELVRQNRNAAWVVTVRPENMGRFDMGKHWRILEYESPPRRWAGFLRQSIFGVAQHSQQGSRE